MKIKKLAIFMIVVFIMLIATVVFSATGEVGLRTNVSQISKGGTFTVTLYASSQDGINGVDTKISYDTEKLELVSHDSTDTHSWVPLGEMPNIIVICNSEDSIKSADVYVLEFKAKDSVAAGETLEVEISDILLDTDAATNSEVAITPKKVEVNVVKTLTKIEVTKMPTKTNYIQNYENINLEGGQLTATYDDNSTETINLTNGNVSVTGFNNSVVGTNTVTVNYGGKSTTMNLTIEAKKLSKIQVTTPPNKTAYIEGENFDKNGMKVTAVYNDNTSGVITNYTITDENNLPVGKTNVTISYTEGGITKTTTQAITVSEKLTVAFANYGEISVSGKKYVANIAPNTNMEQFIAEITTNGTQIQIFEGTTEVTNNSAKMKTGMKLRISFNGQSAEYIVTVKGDTNGDGECDVNDILLINKHRLNKVPLEGEYLLAGYVDEDNDADFDDILVMNKYRLGKVDSL